MLATLPSPMKPQPATAPNVVPMPGELQGAFFDRAFKALEKVYPKINQRSVEVIRLWQKSQTDADLQQEAHDRFPTSKYTHFGPRCIFLSHAVPAVQEERDASGEILTEAREAQVYDRKNLQLMVDFANFRIRNSGMFSALSAGHMPTAEEKEKGRPDAENLGWAGPFYIGLFGNQKPKWAIYADEWILNEHLSDAEKLQRRSPEVWFKEPIETRTMDPIAMLGSETPRLDSGANLYCRRSDGQAVMRYSMASAMPNAMNSYVPDSESGSTHRYGANEMVDPASAGMTDDGVTPDNSQQPGADDALLDAVTDAIIGLMPTIIQKVMDAKKSGNTDDPEAVPQETPPIQTPDTPRGMDTPDSGQEPNLPGANSSPDATAGQSPPPAPGASSDVSQSPPSQPNQPIDEKHAQYSAMSPQAGQAYAEGYACGQKGRSMTTNYSRGAGATASVEELLERQSRQLEAQTKQIAAQAKRIEDLELDKRDVERYARIHQIAETHDIGDEKEVMSDIINVSDEEFDRYCRVLQKSPKRGDLTNVEIFDDPRLDPSTDNYSRSGSPAGRRGKSPSQDEVAKYSRQAADSVARKKARGDKDADFDKEFNNLLVAAGYPEQSAN